MALDLKGYSEANLRRAWKDAKNEDIAASIIGFVRQAALGDPSDPIASGSGRRCSGSGKPQMERPAAPVAAADWGTG